MSFLDRSQPQEREDLLPLGQPSITERLGGAAMELEAIEQIMSRAGQALDDLKRAGAKGDGPAYIAAAHALREAGDLWAAAKHFAKAVERKLR